MRGTVFGLVYGNALMIALLIGAYLFVSYGIRAYCFEGSKGPRPWAFFFSEIVLFLMIGSFCAGIVGQTWYELAGPDDVPAWLTYLFQKR